MFELALHNQELTMSSLEISELTGSRHDSVKRSIERLANSGIIAQPPMVVEQFIDANGQKRYVDVLVFSGEAGKRDSIVVVARISPAFTARIVDRWIELESKPTAPALPNFSNPAEAARAWADQVEENLHKQMRLEAQAPKVRHYDLVVDREGLLNATEVASKFGMTAVKLNQYLEELGVYNRSIQRSRVFNHKFIKDGLGEMRQTKTGHNQAMFTLKGEAWIIQKLTSEGVISA